MQISNQHITFQSAPQMRNLLEPLTKISDITYFTYGVNFPDRSGFTLVTHPEYYEESFREEQPLWGFSLSEGWHTWMSTITDKQHELLAKQGVGHGIMLVRHFDEYTEIVEFATNSNNKKAFDFYLNHANLLKRFTEHFKQEASALIQEAKNQVILPPETMCLVHEAKTSTHLVDENVIQIITPIKSLSKRERSCFNFLIQGYSIASIATELNLAIPTVANYIARIKQKLQCKNRKDMIAIATKYGLIERIA